MRKLTLKERIGICAFGGLMLAVVAGDALDKYSEHRLRESASKTVTETWFTNSSLSLPLPLFCIGRSIYGFDRNHDGNPSGRIEEITVVSYHMASKMGGGIVFRKTYCPSDNEFKELSEFLSRN